MIFGEKSHLCKRAFELVALCTSVGLLVTCGRDPRQDQDEKALNSTWSGLLLVATTMEAALLEAQTSGEPVDFAHVIPKIVRAEGIRQFQSNSQSNAWLWISADIEKWTNSISFRDQVMICDPTRVYVKSLRSSNYVAMTFAGKRVYIQNLPSVEPLDLNRLTVTIRKVDE